MIASDTPLDTVRKAQSTRFNTDTQASQRQIISASFTPNLFYNGLRVRSRTSSNNGAPSRGAARMRLTLTRRDFSSSLVGLATGLFLPGVPSGGSDASTALRAPRPGPQKRGPAFKLGIITDEISEN